jgi:hypothetical protein
MKKMTVVVAAMMLSFGGCQTCNNFTQRVTGHFKGAFAKFGNCGLGNCSLGNCGIGGANNVGAPCDASCEAGYAPMNDPCQPCGETSRYGSYGEVVGEQEGVVIGSYEGVPSGAVMSAPGTSISPSVPSSSTMPSGSYLGSPSSSGIRGESVLPKLAN